MDLRTLPSAGALAPILPPPRRARIAVLCGYMAYYESHMPPGYRAQCEAWGREVAALFDGVGEVGFGGLIADLDAGYAARRFLAAFAPDAIVVVPAMPSPSGLLWAALEPFPRTPVVVWGAVKRETIRPGYNSVDHLDASGNVGVTMITNLLVRHGRPVLVESGLWTDAAARERVVRAVQSGATAGRLRTARIGVLGKPLDGYDNVVTDPAILAAEMGPVLVDISVEEFTETFQGVPKADIDSIADLACASFAVATELPDEFHASARLTAALAATVRRHRLDAGSLNTHKEFGRANPALGLVGGFANTFLTSFGVPFTDTGDILTAIAMLLGRTLAGNGLYCELNTIDAARDLILCCNTGEGDFSQATDPKTCRVFPTGAVTGLKQRGCTVCYEVPPAPAGIIGFSPVAGTRGKHRVMALAGATAGTPEVALHVPHVWFRPAIPTAAAAFARWARAGATHHACLSLGLELTQVAEVCDLLGIDFRDATHA